MSAVLFYPTVKKAIAPIVKPLGFRCEGRFYYKITGNVVQQFCLLWLNHNFTIRFHISSVYGDPDKRIEGSEIMRIINGRNEWLGQRLVEGEPRHFYAQGPTADLFPDYNACANVCVEMLSEHLLPWFDAASNSAAAYQMAKAAGIFWTLHQEPDAIQSLGFLLDMEQWERSSAVLKYYLDNYHLYNQHWWEAKEQEYKRLYEALISMDAGYLEQYMSDKKLETYRLFRRKP